MIKITEVNIKLIKPQDGMIAFASLVVNDNLYLGSVAIHEKLQGGYRITYPEKYVGSQRQQIFHPISRDAGNAIERAIFTKLNEVMKKVSNDRHHDPIIG